MRVGRALRCALAVRKPVNCGAQPPSRRSALWRVVEAEGLAPPYLLNLARTKSVVSFAAGIFSVSVASQ